MKEKFKLHKYNIQKFLKISSLIIFLLVSYWFVYKDEWPVYQETINTNTAKSAEIFSDKNGSPILAMGSCDEDSDCFPTGCSSQVCSDHNVTTTCELGKFPEKETYTCGCQNSKCVWYRYR